MVSDAVVAHVGAFRGDPGIVAICGTGSLVFGVTAAGEQISNYECVHYAPPAHMISTNGPSTRSSLTEFLQIGR